MQKILSLMRHAIDKYNLIQDGDRIAVGISGGKDSLILAKALKHYSKFSKEKFSVVGITIDMFNKGPNPEITKFCEAEDIEYHVIPSNIYETVFEIRKEKNPCSLCSKLRRGMLVTAAKDFNCNKLALGHTADDVVHTFFLSMIYEGRLSSFAPLSYLDRTEMFVIRPLILTDEKWILKEAKNVPVEKSKCPMDKTSKREEIKQLIENLEKQIPISKERIFRAITSPESYNLFDKFEQDIKEFNKNK